MMPSYTHNGSRGTAYQHEKPYQRLVGFLGSMIHIANENVKRLVDEVAMWDMPITIALLGEETCRIQKVDSQATLDAYQADLTMYTELRNKTGFCSNCGGQGWGWQCIAQDESIRVNCTKCDGIGTTPEVYALVKALEAKELADKAQAAVAAKAGAGSPSDFITSIVRKFK